MPRIPDYPEASAPLDGSETIAAWQGSRQVRLPVNKLPVSTGPQGPQGPAGPQGPQGPQGPAGSGGGGGGPTTLLIELCSFYGALGDGEILPPFTNATAIAFPANFAGAAASVLSGAPGQQVDLAVMSWVAGITTRIGTVSISPTGAISFATTNGVAVTVQPGAIYAQGPSVSVPSFTWFSLQLRGTPA